MSSGFDRPEAKSRDVLGGVEIDGDRNLIADKGCGEATESAFHHNL